MYDLGNTRLRTLAETKAWVAKTFQSRAVAFVLQRSGGAFSIYAKSAVSLVDTDPTNKNIPGETTYVKKSFIDTLQPPQPVPQPNNPPPTRSKCLVGTYLPNWVSYGLETITADISIVFLAFIDWYANGYDVNNLRNDVNALKARLPNIKVVVSVGGGGAGNWSNSYSLDALKTFVQNLDWEPDGAWSSNPGIADTYVRIARDFCSILPSPKLLTTAVWMNGTETGNATTALQSGVFDYVNIMSYETDKTDGWDDFARCVQSFAQFVDVRKLAILLESPPEGYGRHVTSIGEATFAGGTANQLGIGMVFTWYFMKSDGFPTEKQYATGW